MKFSSNQGPSKCPLKLICYMATPGGLTGAPRRLLTLCQVLKKYGISPVIVSEPQSDLIQEARQMGVATVGLSPQGVLTLRHGALFGGGFIFRVRVFVALLVHNFKFYLIVREHKADVVWVRGSKGVGFIGAGTWFSGKPLIWDVDYEPPSRGVVRVLHRFGLYIASRVVFQYSAAATSIFGEGLTGRFRWKFHTLIPGIDLTVFRSFDKEHNGKANQESIPFTILNVGTICDRKNQSFLLDVLKVMIKKGNSFHVLFRFVGGTHDTEYYEDLKKRIEDSGLVQYFEFLGWRDDVHELMLAADIVVLPSKDEGVPNAIQEAMALGLPVIVGKSGGMPEIVEHGQTGWVLPIDAPDAWASKIVECIKNLEVCRSVGKSASVYAKDNFTTLLWAEKYAHIIKPLQSHG